MRRRAIPWALAAALTSIAFDVGAEPTKAECVAAHEQGQRLSKAGRIREAVGVLGQCALETCPSIISVECSVWLAEAKRDLPSVVVEAIAFHGQAVVVQDLRIDGAPAAPSEVHSLDPGEHTVVITTAAGSTASSTFSVARGEQRKRITVRLAAPPAPATPVATAPVAAPIPTSAPPPRPCPVTGTRLAPSAVPYAWAFAAAGGAALASFAWFGLSGRSKERDMDRDCAPFCAQSDVDAMHRDYVVADVSLGLGVAALGVSLWILHAYREPAGRASTPALGARPATWRLEF